MADTNLTAQALGAAARPTDIRTLIPPASNTAAVRERAPALVNALEARPAQDLQLEDFEPAELREVAAAFGDVVSVLNRDLRVQIDEATGRIVTQIVDGRTNEVLRQLPPEALLSVARRVADLVGLIIDEER